MSVPITETHDVANGSNSHSAISIHGPTSDIKMATYERYRIQNICYQTQFSSMIGYLNNFSVVWIEIISISYDFNIVEALK